MDSFVLDIVVFEDFSAQVIEINPFGSNLSSGSALFSWKKDQELMYGKLNLKNPPIRILKELIPKSN